MYLSRQADLVESFAAKFGRMQDTTGDKLLPLFLRLVGEKTGTAIDNLNRGERLGLVPDAARWLEMRPCAASLCMNTWKPRRSSPEH